MDFGWSTLKRRIRFVDWISMCSILTLLCIGLLFIFSATHRPSRPFSIFVKKQFVGIITGFTIYLYATGKDLRSLVQWGYYGFFLTLLLLMYTLTSGMIGMGAQRWISLYFFRFQPAEIVKVTLPFFLAVSIGDVHARSRHAATTLSSYIKPLLSLTLVFVLILKQPDLGTALLIMFSGLTVLWVAGLSRRFFVISICLLLVSAPLAYQQLKPYQQRRILTLFGYGSAHNERYQIEQSKIAIGSGGIYGKGFMRGTQNQLGFLPEDHTDFIFSVVCEEWGLIGALFVIGLFCLLFSRLLFMILGLPMLFEQLLALGLLMPILYSTLINIGMVLGILPTVGIPLPFLTYGLTHTWITMLNLGLLHNIALRRHTL